MKLFSWNINGFRAILNKGFCDFVKKHEPDILCLQEIKAHAHQCVVELEGYENYWNSAQRPGYSGTGVLTKIKPINIEMGLGLKDHDQEGRVMTLEFPEFYLVNVYTPNAGEELKRLPYRMEWDQEFLKFLKKLEKKKPVIFCGDLNVAHTEIDLANPKANRHHSGFTDEERADFTKLLEAGFIDSFRHFHPGEPKHYTWWTYRFNARAKNVGWRIDYFCLSKNLQPLMKEALIQPEVMGSDHCPVGLILK